MPWWFTLQQQILWQRRLITHPLHLLQFLVDQTPSVRLLLRQPLIRLQLLSHLAAKLHIIALPTGQGTDANQIEPEQMRAQVVLHQATHQSRLGQEHAQENHQMNPLPKSGGVQIKFLNY